MEYNNLLKHLGFHFKLARMKAGLSQGQLAEILNSHERYISDIECGKRNITIKTIHKFSTALNVKLPELFEFDK